MWRKRSVELTLEFRVGWFNIYKVLCYWQWIAYCVLCFRDEITKSTLEVTTYLRHFVEYNSIFLQLLCFLMKWRNFLTTTGHKLNLRIKETAKNMKRTCWIVWTTWKIVWIFWLTVSSRDSRCKNRNIHIVWKGDVSSINQLLKSREPEISPHIVCYIVL